MRSSRSTLHGLGLLFACLGLLAAVLAVPASGHEEDVPKGEAYVDPDLREEELGLPGNWATSEGWQRDSEAVRTYGSDNEISTDEAYDVLTYQERVVVATAGLYDALAGTISRLEFVPGESTIIIHVTEERPGDRAVVESILGPDADSARIVPGAAMTMRDQVEFQIRNHADIDAVTGVVLDLETDVTQLSHSCQHLTGHVSEGGRLILHKPDFRSYVIGAVPFNNYTDCVSNEGNLDLCTNALAATMDGYEGYVTAGHCTLGQNATDYWTEMYAYDMTHPYASHRYYQGYDNYYSDAAFIRERYGSTSLSNKIYIDEEAGFRTITSHIGGSPPVYAYVCGKGAANAYFGYLGWNLYDDTAGYFCGYVTASTSSLGNLNKYPLNFAQFTIADSYVNAGRVAIGGDSGGPVWAGSTFYGTIVSGSQCVYLCSTNEGFKVAGFEHAAAIETWLGVSLYTG